MKITKSIVAGQCLMNPPKDERKFKFLWYNLGGCALNIIVAILLFIAAGIFISNDTVKDILVAGVTANVVMALLNLIPISSSIPNDGLNAITALKSKLAAHGFYLMLAVNDETMSGRRFRDFEPQMFSIPDSANYDNYFVAYIVTCEAARLYDMGEYNKSVEQYKRLNINKLHPYYRNSVNLDLLYHYTIHKPDFNKAKEIYTDKRMKTYLKFNTPTVIRALASYEYFVNKDEEKGRLLLSKAKMAAENYPNAGIKSMEKDYCLELESKFNSAAL